VWGKGRINHEVKVTDFYAWISIGVAYNYFKWFLLLSFKQPLNERDFEMIKVKTNMWD